MRISSPDFQNNQSIPDIFTCDGADSHPALEFFDIPAGTQSLAVVCEDPDVPRTLRQDGMWYHWVVWNMPPSANGIAAGAEPSGVVGTNSWGKNAYGGPCPPDREHRYFFRLWAVDTMLALPASADRLALAKALEGHVIGEAELTGRYNCLKNR